MPQKQSKRGRPAGSPNKANTELRVLVKTLLADTYDAFREKFYELETNEFVRNYISLFKYATPPLQATTEEIDFNDMSEPQLDYIIECLRSSKKPLKSEFKALKEPGI